MGFGPPPQQQSPGMRQHTDRTFESRKGRCCSDIHRPLQYNMECSNYTIIALISHTSKILLKIIQKRLEQYIEREMPSKQAGFRHGRGTRDQIANLRWILEKARERNKDIFLCFIDYQKAFDSVRHNRMWAALRNMGVPQHLTNLIRALYTDQLAYVQTDHGTTERFPIQKGV